MWIWILLLVIISIYNTIYGFLPDSLSNKVWIRSIGVFAASVLLIYGILQMIASYKNSSSAYISPGCQIIKSRNFPWKIVKNTDSNGNFPVYIIESRYGDSSEVKIKPDRRVSTEVYNSAGGIGIKFFCKPDEVPNFKIKIGP